MDRAGVRRAGGQAGRHLGRRSARTGPLAAAGPRRNAQHPVPDLDRARRRRSARSAGGGDQPPRRGGVVQGPHRPGASCGVPCRFGARAARQHRPPFPRPEHEQGEHEILPVVRLAVRARHHDRLLGVAASSRPCRVAHPCNARRLGNRYSCCRTGSTADYRLISPLSAAR